MSKKAPNALDQSIGAQVRARRLQVGMSQEKLGDALGLTFQQIQKYEKGTNRMAISRLDEIAKALGVDISFFLEGTRQTISAETSHPLGKEEVEFAVLFNRIADQSLRKAILSLARAASATA